MIADSPCIGARTPANNHAYFAPIQAEIRDPEFAALSFEYMASREDDEASVNTCFMTQYKREQQLGSVDNSLKFIIHCCENGRYRERRGEALR
jgi:hypothetical protein